MSCQIWQFLKPSPLPVCDYLNISQNRSNTFRKYKKGWCLFHQLQNSRIIKFIAHCKLFQLSSTIQWGPMIHRQCVVRTILSMKSSTACPAFTSIITRRGRFSLATMSSIEVAPMTCVPFASRSRNSVTLDTVRLNATTCNAQCQIWKQWPLQGDGLYGHCWQVVIF